MLKKTLAALALVVPLTTGMTTAHANEEIPVDKAPINLQDKASLQRGAKAFVNYCLNCHSAGYMRYSRLTDLGLTEDQIKSNLMFATDKIGSTMTIAMKTKEAKEWFGAAPPDLTVIARARGANWLYTYLRGFYRDETRPTGWNNIAFDKVGMPHVLWELQGTQTLKVEKHGEHETKKLVLEQAGKMTGPEFDAFAADLVNYLAYMGEPMKMKRQEIGLYVVAVLFVLFVFSYLLKREYWNDIH